MTDIGLRHVPICGHWLRTSCVRVQRIFTPIWAIDSQTAWSEPLSSARAAAGLPEILVRWAEKLWAHCSDKELDATDLWNFDEKGVQAGSVHRKKLVVRRSRVSFDRQRRGPGAKDNITLVECCSAAGTVLPPLVIMKGTRTELDWCQSNLVPTGKFYSYIAYMLTIYRLESNEHRVGLVQQRCWLRLAL